MIHWPASYHYGRKEARSCCGVWLPSTPSHMRERNKTYEKNFSASLREVDCPKCLKIRIEIAETVLKNAKKRLEAIIKKEEDKNQLELF